MWAMQIGRGGEPAQNCEVFVRCCHRFWGRPPRVDSPVELFEVAKGIRLHILRKIYNTNDGVIILSSIVKIAAYLVIGHRFGDEH